MFANEQHAGGPSVTAPTNETPGRLELPVVLSPFRALVPRVRQPVARVVRWLLLVVSGWLLISLAHQTAVLGLAYLMRWIGSSAWAQSAVDLLPLDQVHARLMLESFAAIAPAGLSVGGPIADTANRIFPGLGLLPHIGPAGCRCLISVRMEGDSSFTGVAFVMALGLVLVLVLSMILTHASRHRIRLTGGFLLLYGVLSVLALPWDLPQFEAMGLASAATKLFDITGETYATYRALIAVLLPLGVKLGIILAGIVAGQLLVTFWHRVVERVSFAAVRRRAMLGPLLAFRQIQHHRRVTIALALVLFLTGFRGSVSYVRMDAGEEQPGSQTMGIIVGSGPSTVKVERLAAGYQYLVNGKADVIRGMGYNPKDLDVTPEEAAARYHRDFKLMRESGVNTVIGWSEQAFDRTLLDVANQEGLGVVLPLELPVDVDYRDWAVRARLMQRVTAWVSEYKAHPALRMWGIGNEVLHDLIDTSPEQYDAFAAFLIDASDLIHTMDPAHPVVYREAEDVFVPVIYKAMQAKPANRPWFVFGLNFYTPRLQEALQLWRDEGFPYPVMVSEFGPHSFLPANRGMGYIKLWRIIRQYPDIALGGVAYVWYADGPEAIDNIFGFVDNDGQPVDRALAQLGATYIRTAKLVAAREAGLPTPTPRPTAAAPKPTATPDVALTTLPTGAEAQRIIDEAVKAAVAKGLSNFEVRLDRRVGEAVVANIVPKAGGPTYEAVLRPASGGWSVVALAPKP